MPTYDLRNTKTGETKEMILSISKKEEMVASGDWQQAGDDYYLEGQGPKLTFTIETRAGTVTLQNP